MSDPKPRDEMTAEQGDIILMFTTIGLMLLTVFLSLSSAS